MVVLNNTQKLIYQDDSGDRYSDVKNTDVEK